MVSSNIGTVLVTGGAGYIGNFVVRFLLNKGYKVRVLDSLIFGDGSLENFQKDKNFELIKGDIRHIEDLACASYGTDAIVFLAGLVGDPACALDEVETITTNVEATKAAVEIAKRMKVKRFIFASTCSVYGATDNYLLNEGSILNPVSLYAQTKIDSERIILGAKDNDFHPVMLRYGTVYGASERMRFDLVLNILTIKALLEKHIKIFGGDQWRPMLHVKDAARSCVIALEAPVEKISGEVFNVGSFDQNYKIIELGEIVKHLIKGTKIEHVTQSVDKRSYKVSFKKIEQVLGFKTKHTADEGVQEMIELIKSKKIEDYANNKYHNVKYKYL